MLEYLESQLRMIKLLRLKTFPPSRDIIDETVKVMSVPEKLRDHTQIKRASFKEILSSLESPSKTQQQSAMDAVRQLTPFMK